jgi:hypothetical protein
MTFSVAQYETVLAKITTGVQELSGKLQDIGPAAATAADNAFIPSWVAARVVQLADELVSLGKSLLAAILDVLKFAFAPVLMFNTSFEWGDVRGVASGIASDLNETSASRAIGDYWTGQAADAYGRAVQPQADAAARISTVAKETATTLAYCASAGMAFYLAVAAVVVKFTLALIAGIAAMGTVVFSLFGVAEVITMAGVSAGELGLAAGAVITFLGFQAQQMSSLHGDANDITAFPDGHWPDGTPGRYADSTVTDGDADWSVR